MGWSSDDISKLIEFIPTTHPSLNTGPPLHPLAIIMLVIASICKPRHPLRVKSVNSSFRPKSFHIESRQICIYSLFRLGISKTRYFVSSFYFLNANLQFGATSNSTGFAVIGSSAVPTPPTAISANG